MSGWLILLDYCITPALLYTMVANWGTMLVPNSPWWLWIIVFVAFNTFVNIRGVSLTRGIDFVIFAVEIVAVIAFVALGCNFILGGGGAGEFNMDPIWQPEKVTFNFLAAGISIAALNFLGFDGISTLAEETDHPEKNIGRGILIALGIIEPAEAKTHPERHRLTQHLGIFPDELIIQPHTVQLPVRPGDRFLLCSDGLTDMLEEEDLSALLRSQTAAPACAAALYQLAMQRGGKDNISVLLVGIDR